MGTPVHQTIDLENADLCWSAAGPFYGDPFPSLVYIELFDVINPIHGGLESSILKRKFKADFSGLNTWGRTCDQYEMLVELAPISVTVSLYWFGYGYLFRSLGDTICTLQHTNIYDRWNDSGTKDGYCIIGWDWNDTL